VESGKWKVKSEEWKLESEKIHIITNLLVKDVSFMIRPVSKRDSSLRSGRHAGEFFFILNELLGEEESLDTPQFNS